MKVRYTVLDGEIVEENRNGVITDYVAEPLGSTVALLDGSHTKSDTFNYWPYGEVQSRSGSTPTPFQFVGTLGYYRDSSARTYVRARYYRQTLGRWQTVDPVFGGETSGWYCDGRPTVRTDPSGLIPGWALGVLPQPWQHIACDCDCGFISTELRQTEDALRKRIRNMTGKDWARVRDCLWRNVKGKHGLRCFDEFYTDIVRVRNMLRHYVGFGGADVTVECHKGGSAPCSPGSGAQTAVRPGGGGACHITLCCDNLYTGAMVPAGYYDFHPRPIHASWQHTLCHELMHCTGSTHFVRSGEGGVHLSCESWMCCCIWGQESDCDVEY
ncbi:MAG: RHS repeat-associated core domain-containing protein [Fimbriimonadales bacterium]